MSDYVNFIVEKGSKFDELALMIFLIATKCHIGVIHLDNSMWTTNESGDMEECEVLLLNRGNLMFESVEMIEVENEDDEAARKKTQHIILKMKKRITRVEEMVTMMMKGMKKRKGMKKEKGVRNKVMRK